MKHGFSPRTRILHKQPACPDGAVLGTTHANPELHFCWWTHVAGCRVVLADGTEHRRLVSRDTRHRTITGMCRIGGRLVAGPVEWHEGCPVLLEPGAPHPVSATSLEARLTALEAVVAEMVRSRITT